MKKTMLTTLLGVCTMAAVSMANAEMSSSMPMQNDSMKCTDTAKCMPSNTMETKNSTTQMPMMNNKDASMQMKMSENHSGNTKMDSMKESKNTMKTQTMKTNKAKMKTMKGKKSAGKMKNKMAAN